ncbi:MAG: ABC transporter substrate-binding protein [Bradyrhizobium sp.]|nr:ABC transporter substrate-binding protein [Bradyrhizobium sp.]
MLLRPSEGRNVARNRTRRAALGLMAAGIAGPVMLARAAAESQLPVRMTLSTPGSAGSIWRSAIARLDSALLSDIDLQWVLGDPGQVQVQLTAGALDVGVFGAIGLATIARKGSDIVLFGPALNNHGRVIVRADSPYQKLSDLVGKRIATQPQTTETYQQARVALSLIGLDMDRDFELIFGPPMASLALFNRGDVDAVIVVEPTATRAIGAGARELARISDVWKQANGEAAVPFLVGLAARRSWIDANRAVATSLARVFAAANDSVNRNPQLFVEFHEQMGLRGNEAAAIALLPSRLADVYPSVWDETVWKAIDQQTEIAVKLGLLEAAPKRRLYDGVALGKV